MTLAATRIEISTNRGVLGAIVTGIDASRPVQPEVILQLKQALRDRHLRIFKNQTLDDEQQISTNYFDDIFPQPA